MGIFGNGVNGLGGGAAGIGAVGGSTFNMKAGAAAVLGAIMSIGPDGLAYPARTLDYAAKANLGEYPVAATLIGAGVPLGSDRYQAVRAANGDIYMAAASTGGNGMAIFRYAANGDLLGRVEIEAFAAVPYHPRLVILSNGNIALAYSTGVNQMFAVVSPSLEIVKAATLIERSNQANSMIALRGGGFMVTFQAGTNVNPERMRMAVYDNAGAVVTALFDYLTWAAGNTPSVFPRLAELSNGNVAVALSCGTGGGAVVGLRLGVVSPNGNAVVATAVVDATPVISGEAEISVMDGYFCVGTGTSAQLINARVYTNAMAQRGPTTALPSTNYDLAGYKVMNDGTSFWLANVATNIVGSAFQLTRVSNAGAAVTFAVGNSVSQSQNMSFEGFCENGRVVIWYYHASTGGARICVFNTTSLLQDTVALVVAPIAGRRARLIPGGDFTAITVSGESSLQLAVVKYANASVVGVATAAVAQGSLVPIASLSGAYGTAPLIGSASRQFDHTTANIAGNKGALLTYGAILKGIV